MKKYKQKKKFDNETFIKKRMIKEPDTSWLFEEDDPWANYSVVNQNSSVGGLLTHYTYTFSAGSYRNDKRKIPFRKVTYAFNPFG
jgi:hypothetical protein